MQQPTYHTTISGGSGGIGGASENIGGAGGTGAGSKVTMVNTPSQTFLQSPFLATTAGVEIGQVVYNNPQNVKGPGQISALFKAMDESFSDCEIYSNQLLRRGRGFPLYVPGPSETLPAEYRVKGVEIGDVGTVTQEGLFNFLFNIYLGADDPININAPEGFHPLEPKYDDRRDLVIDRPSPGSYVSTSLIHMVVDDSNPQLDDFPGGDFVFSCRPPQGAVLALPHGAVLKRLTNIQPVREYARKNAESWYAYMEGARGLAVDNGSLYLITGYEKAMSWGLGAYHSTQDGDEFIAYFKPIQQSEANPQYRWMGSGRFPVQHKHYNRPFLTDDTLNQTVFIHGLSISIREKSWGSLFTRATVDVDINNIEQSQSGNATGNSGNQSQGSSSFSWLLGFFSGGSASHGRQHAQEAENVIVSDCPHIPNIFHPGKLINEYLLYKVPEAVVAMSHDDDWATILDENPNTGSKIENLSDMFEHIEKEFSICNNDKVTPQMVFLVRQSPPQENSEPKNLQKQFGNMRHVAQTRYMGGGGGNSVTQLNNYLQARDASHTVMWEEYSTGPSHAIKWTVECKVSGKVKGTGTADSKAAAKEEAARMALIALGI
ncbi:Pleiotropic drug resistance ABC transporter protein [Mycena sanguinolenta]|uniref:Pleiotropic drug resistance ABC transporter protein n=1 Tax=Mycena sanguinolenta TaxID=230812 RepID=A0A8H6XKD0_9AGAR|nr:Pleiotropic drug resistance ABC transporter protein [Mycena sanguinolenta]